jgi:hypothetical protein
MNNADYTALMAQCIELATKLVICEDYKGYRNPESVISIAKQYFNSAINPPNE